MSKLITMKNLTPQKIDMQAKYFERFVRAAKSTSRADRPRAERAVLELYRYSKLAAPKAIIWVPSPLVCLLAGPLAAIQIAIHREKSMDSAVDSAVRSAVGSLWHRYLGGQMWAWYSSYYAYMHDVLGVAGAAPIQPYVDLCESSGPAWPHRDFCIISERHTRICIADGQPHCEDGPSLQWEDGWNLWFIRGVRVTEQIVMRPETQSILDIDNEKNNDIRSIRIARYAGANTSSSDGWARYLKESGAQGVDARKHPREGTPETLYVDKRGSKRLVVTDPSTNKLVALGVPREVTTCAQAQAWVSHGSDEFAMCRT